MRAGQYSRKDIEKGIRTRGLTNERFSRKSEKKINIPQAECVKIVRERKVALSKKTEKTYRVTITYVHISEEEAIIKRAIIESIMKKGYTK